MAHRRPRSRSERLRDNIQARIDKANAGGGGPPISIKDLDAIEANAQMWEDRESGTGGGEINPSRENVGTGLSRGPKEPDKPRADPNALYQTTDSSLDNYVHESWINDWTLSLIHI